MLPLNILERIHGHQDLADLNDEQRLVLCQQIREFLVSSVSKTGGHLASNLGVVELTVALETVFNTEKDRLVFDVGHQSYVHKLLTGRQADFACLRQFGGIAGFPKPSESPTDAFVAGHASSSVSIALGMARARTLQKLDYQVVALIGDGAATGGMAYEGLNDAAVSNEPMVIVLNDNAMSIDRNVGGMASHLSKLRTKQRYLGMKRRYRALTSKLPFGNGIYRFTRKIKDGLRRALIPSTIFESMGFTYLGPVDGHDLPSLIALLKSARDMQRPVVVHVMTQKGRGYLPAQNHPKRFHGIGKFDPQSGELLKESAPSFSEAFGSALCELAQENPRICAITAAMPGGTGLLPFKEKFPERMFDVGIAEEHAVSMAGGLAKQGMIPVAAIYSTFLQRAYDMILQDIALQKLHVILAVDRAGLVGEDGETHHGIFDVGFLRQIPGLTVLCPGSMAELQEMLKWSVNKQSGPVAIRYPRGSDQGYAQSAWMDMEKICVNGALSVCKAGRDIIFITYGTICRNVMEAAQLLEQRGVSAGVLRLLTVAPLPVDAILQTLGQCKRIVVVEEVCSGSGVCEALAYQLTRRLRDCIVSGMDLGHNFVTHGALDTLYSIYGLDSGAIAGRALEVLKVEN